MSSRSSAGGRDFARLTVENDGEVRFLDADDRPLPPRAVKAVREEMGEDLKVWLSEQCEKWNQGISHLLELHFDTPDPTRRPRFASADFDAPPPVLPVARSIDLLGMLWRPRRERIETENARTQQEFEEARRAWAVAAAEHAGLEEQRRDRFQAAMSGEAEAMEDLLEQVISTLELPWQSGVAFELEGPERVWIDLDLPEVEDMPRQEASLATRGVRIRVKDRSDTRIRREYAQLVHAIAFRVTGEAFAALPGIREVVISAYSQRADRQTAHTQDDYLLSTRIGRGAWSEIDFSQLPSLDLIAAFERYDLVRKVTKTGVFSAIQPHAR